MAKYLREYSTAKTPQSESIEGTVPNSAGGYSFVVDDWKRLERFLLLGSSNGTYYINEQQLTRENAKVVEKLIKKDGKRVVETIVSISDEGRAPKNDPALFALAMCAKLGDEETRTLANRALPKVARIGTHLLHYAQFIQQFGGWGHGTVRSFQRWFTERTPDDVAFQAIKYASRDGWSQADLLRQAHPKSEAHNYVFKYIVDGPGELDLETLPHIIKGTELIKGQADKKKAANFIKDYNLPREVVPTELLNEKIIWEALLDANMGLTAIMRNLGKMTSLGLLDSNLSAATKKIVESFGSESNIKKARVHPLNILVALKVYEQGHGDKGSLKWSPVRAIIDALDSAFYLSFKTVEPTHRNLMLALDVSGSMGSPVSGMPLDCRTASAAMALVTANVEPNYEIVGFTSGNRPSMHRGYNTGISPLSISPKQRLDDVVKYIDRLDFGGTDCSLPMIYAEEKKLDIDAFFVYTDSETWAGKIHPKQALDSYRRKSGKNAKSIVIGMNSNGFTIADPNDAGMMDVCGFDTAAPAVMADFVRN